MPNRTKKILMLGPFPEPTTGVSLANKVAKKLLKEAGYSVSMINTSYSKFDENIGKFSLHKLFFYLKFYFLSYRVLQHRTIYITPGQSFFGVAKYTLFIWLAKLFSKELIIHVHGNHLGKEYQNLKGFKRTFFKHLLSKSTKGIVLSKSLMHNMSPFIDDSKIYVLHNFAEDYLWENLPKQQADELRIIYLSNLMEEKGIFYLLEALKQLENNGYTFKAKIAGAMDRERIDELESVFSNLRQTEYVGVVLGEEKKNLLSWGNIFALPTFYQMEGQPISILEAMATGNLIITTRHAGIPDIILDGSNGYFVSPKDVNGLVNIIEKLQENKADVERIARQNIEEFKTKYTIQNFRESLISIFEV